MHLNLARSPLDAPLAKFSGHAPGEGPCLKIFQEPNSIEGSNVLDQPFGPQSTIKPPRVLLVSTNTWQTCARLALKMKEAGFDVAVISPPGNVALKLDEDLWRKRLPLLNQEQFIERTARQLKPALTIPCDEGAVLIIERGLTSPRHIGSFLQRTPLIEFARENGIRAPLMKKIFSSYDLERWNRQHSFPAVLKSDGSAGGNGVRIVFNLESATAAFETMRRPLHLPRAIAASLKHLDLSSLYHWSQNMPNAINIQEYVLGKPANVSVAAINGKVKGMIAVEVVETQPRNGPGNVFCRSENAEVLAAAEKLVSALKFTGLCGIDFLIDAGKAAHLIEFNARATPASYLSFGPGQNLVHGLRESFGGEFPALPPDSTTNKYIATSRATRDQVSRFKAWVDRPKWKLRED